MPSWRNVYLKLVQAKGLKAADIGGTSDPYAVVFGLEEEGKKTRLETPVLKKTRNPCWNQEFVVSVGVEDFALEILIYDWNRVMNHELIGKAKIDIGKSEANVTYSEWLPVEKKGSLQVVYCVSPLITLEWPPGRMLPWYMICSALTQANHVPSLMYPEPVSRFRVHLERDGYYPGETVRGVIVANCLKPSQAGDTMSLSITNSSYASADDGRLASTKLYDAETTEFPVKFGVGCHVLPFEIVLPMELFSTVLWADASSRTYITVSSFSPSRLPHWAYFDCTVLPSRSFTIPRVPSLWTPDTKKGCQIDALVPANLKEEERIIWYKLNGPTQMWAGESYTFRIKVRHFGKATVQEIKFELERMERCCAVTTTRTRKAPPGEWSRHSNSKRVPGISLRQISAPISPDSPLMPGMEWESDVTVDVASDLEPTLHVSHSPLLQISYAIKVEMFTTEGPSLVEIRGEEHIDGADLPVLLLNTTLRPPVSEPHPRICAPQDKVGPIFVWDSSVEGIDPNPILVPNLNRDNPHFAGSNLSEFFPSTKPSFTATYVRNTSACELREDWAGFGEVPSFLTKGAKHGRNLESHDDVHFADSVILAAAAVVPQ